MNNENNNNRKKLGKSQSKPGVARYANLNKEEESQDILAMIRARQEERRKEPSESEKRTKLKEFLDNLDVDTCEQDYSETPIYKLGYQDGYDQAEEIYINKVNMIRNSLKSLLVDV